jgi:hypothetical protein
VRKEVPDGCEEEKHQEDTAVRFEKSVEEKMSDRDDGASRPSASLRTTLAVALINLFLGTLVGGAVTAHFAEEHSDRELQRTWLQERSKHQMSVRKSFLDEQQATVSALYTLISRLRIASGDLIDITSPEYEERNFSPGEARRGMKKLKIDRKNAFNDAADEWENSRYFYDFALAPYQPDGGKVQRAWSGTRDAATKLGECASEWYFQVFNGEVKYTKETPEPCSKESDALDQKWHELSSTLRDTRQKAWSDWENPPERLKTSSSSK